MLIRAPELAKTLTFEERKMCMNIFNIFNIHNFLENIGVIGIDYRWRKLNYGLY